MEILPEGIEPVGVPWYGMDLDGTLTYCESGDHDVSKIGRPIFRMVDRVRMWIQEGKHVKIFTARVNTDCYSTKEVLWSIKLIQAFCKEQFGQLLPITCAKDKWMVELWDDRVVQIVTNTGYRANEAKLRIDGW